MFGSYEFHIFSRINVSLLTTQINSCMVNHPTCVPPQKRHPLRFISIRSVVPYVPPKMLVFFIIAVGNFHTNPDPPIGYRYHQ